MNRVIKSPLTEEEYAQHFVDRISMMIDHLATSEAEKSRLANLAIFIFTEMTGSGEMDPILTIPAFTGPDGEFWWDEEIDIRYAVRQLLINKWVK